MSTSTVIQPLLLSITRVLDEVGVSRRELDRWRQKGLTPPFLRLPNGQLRIRYRDLRAWVDEGDPCALPSVTKAQAAAEFGLPVRVFSSWVEQGLVTGVPANLPIDGRIERGVLDAWVESLPGD